MKFGLHVFHGEVRAFDEANLHDASTFAVATLGERDEFFECGV